MGSASQGGKDKNDTSRPFRTSDKKQNDAPPGYISVAVTPGTENHDSIIDFVARLNFSNKPDGFPHMRSGLDADACLTHLKLLHALHSLKEDVGYTDGLWNIWNSRADHGQEDLITDNRWKDAQDLSKKSTDERKVATLSRIREKRWALFVARAVDRYEAWWNSMAATQEMLTEEEMTVADSTRYIKFPDCRTPMDWEEQILPPLDVLMIMHTHMLNPRSFLEDTMRYGMDKFWTAGMPWRLIENAIDADFNYNVSDKAKENWVARTGRQWANRDDPMTKMLECPFCQTKNEVPWTTCRMAEDPTLTRFPGLIGYGYGDGYFQHKCPSCKNKNYKKLLSVSKFVSDVSLRLNRSVPMPGTLLDPRNGRPVLLAQKPSKRNKSARMFPNRMIQQALRTKIMELIKPPEEGADSNKSSRVSMENVRDMIQELMCNAKKARHVDYDPKFFSRYSASSLAKICVRKMMSRYWENFSPFALDLCAAVMRQGVFIEKMVKIDWLHSLTARDTMVRVIKKYKCFLKIIQKYPDNFAVPTLDVDLAWHTHQLSPVHYYYYTVTKTKKFIDHDDKIDEDKLGKSFEWTTKRYENMFNAIYSECTCWYCETIRSSQISSVGTLLGVSGRENIAESFHNSGTAGLCPPDNSAHISSHNAVKTRETADRLRVTKRLRDRQHALLEKNYQKAVKRAEKQGRTLPPREEYYDHWGRSYYMYGPYMYAPYLAAGMYYGWDPCIINNGVGAWANCAVGTCGSGGIAAGACGGPGGCGNGSMGSYTGVGGGGGGGTGGGGGGGCGGGCGGG